MVDAIQARIYEAVMAAVESQVPTVRRRVTVSPEAHGYRVAVVLWDMGCPYIFQTLIRGRQVKTLERTGGYAEWARSAFRWSVIDPFRAALDA